MDIEEMNQTINSWVKPGEIMNRMKEVAQGIAGLGTMEAEIALERAGKIVNQLIRDTGNTVIDGYGKVLKITADEGIRILDKTNEMNLNNMKFSIMNNARQLYPKYDEYAKQFSNPKQIYDRLKPNRQVSAQEGGGDESEFMKYVYTEKPIWFTKKDMIWN
jgi:hypothetical protein